MESSQEQIWIEQSRAGNQQAFESLIRCHAKMIHSVAYRMTGSMEDAEDLAQETFIRAYKQIAEYRGDAKFSSWLCRIAINASLNWRKRESRREQIHRRWAADNIEHAYELGDYEESELGLRVRSALSRLPEKQRAVVVLTVYEQMSYSQVAGILKCSVMAVACRLFAARAQLKRSLKSCLAESRTTHGGQSKAAAEVTYSRMRG